LSIEPLTGPWADRLTRPTEGTLPRAGYGRLPWVAAIALSAFVLFTLEFWAGRMLLPAFGGSPGVWATALAFFATLLFLGYLYAHLLATRVSRSRAGVIHTAVCALAVAAAVLAPQDMAALRVAGMAEALNVLLALLIVVGAPAFLLTTTTPLLSAWYATRARDPWWLFAASNAASLAALIAYPALIEPLVGLSTQHVGLVAGLALFSALVVALVLETRRSPAATSPAAVEAGQRADDARVTPAPLTLTRQALWLLAAFVPAGLLAATTNFLTTDLVAAPLLWVGPLAIYLASFVVAFSERGRRWLRFIAPLVPGAATLLWIPYVAPLNWPVVALLIVVLGSFAVLATALHGRLALDRPSSEHLTRFYLVVAAGGMLATAFVALAAPVIFPDVYEYPLLIVGGLVVLAMMHRRLSGRRVPSSTAPSMPEPSLVGGMLASAVALLARLLPYLSVAGLLIVLSGGELPAGALLLLVVGALFVAAASTPWLAVGAVSIAIVAALSLVGPGVGQQELFKARSFFGVTEVQQSDSGVALYSGTTLHGLQLPGERRLTPTTYYSRPGPLGDVFADLHARVPGGVNVGVVGLGAGTAAVYAEPGDSMTFFEIDPLVIEVAQDARYFTFLAEARGEMAIVPGDGRLSLDAAPPGSFDLLVVDAFSSDVVPPHLLTQEALRVYVRAIRPGGVVALHVSNRYYDLPLAVAATARQLGLEVRLRGHEPDDEQQLYHGATASKWTIVGRAADVARFDGRGWRVVEGADVVLTDDFPDLMRVLHGLR
jgi:SAM-dependent methyltransferase